MIKLTIYQNDRDPEELTFDKSSVKIGTDNQADLELDISAHAELEIEIFEQKGRFYVYNQSNNPYISLNNLPFHKKSIESKAQLNLEKIRIDIEVEVPAPQETPSTPPLSKISVQEAISLPLAKAPVEPPEPKPETLPPEKIDVAALVQEVEALHPSQMHIEDFSGAQNFEKTLALEEDPSPELMTSPSPKDEAEATPLKQTYQRKRVNKNEKPLTYSQPSWGFMLSLGAIILAFITLLIGTVYLKISSESDKDEIKAIETVADAAMALAHAQITHLKPQKSNWSHPDFLKASLTSILPPQARPLIDVDAQGKFHNCPYLLRIYTSSDLKNFLVIAQPAPSTWQWLLPRAAIVIDSTAMEIRKTTDLKNLNRLLVNINTLDELNPAEISQAVKEGKLIPLASLKMSKRAREFAPPKALSLSHAGAENFIYNAPRYHLLGESLLEKAVHLMEHTATTEEVSQFQQEVENIKKLPDLILYSTKGIEGALAAEKALTTFAPKSRFLIGYLKINAQGNVIANNLLLNEEISPKSSEEIESPAVPSQEPQPSQPLDTPAPAEKSEITQDLQSHPLYLQLVQLGNARKNVLKPVQDKMMELLKREHAEFVPDFPMHLQTVLNEYQTISQEHQTTLAEEFFNLYHQYQAIPLKELMTYVQKAGLEPLLDEILKVMTTETHLTEELFTTFLEKIKHSTNFTELYQHINEMAPQLSLEKFPFPQKLIAYQQAFRSEAIATIEKFLLSAEHKLNPAKLQAPAKETFTKILDLVWITASTEREFYLNEFALLAQQPEVKE
ncbi:MAG: hypothetical protein CK425_05635 [Parachlamydia sp.]|nr:MAG: hypothetical protein CK425_05635 [Parachlamydia sp.]